MSQDVVEELYARQVLVERVRRRMRDFGPLNTLVEGEENTDRMIMQAALAILDDFNSEPPSVGIFGISNFPSATLLEDGMIARLLESAAILYMRNELDYSHEGTTVRFNQAQTYLQKAAQLEQKYESKKARLKVGINMQQAVQATGGHHTSLILLYSPTWGVRNLTSHRFLA